MRVTRVEDAGGIGHCRGTPLIDAELIRADVPDEPGEPVWRVSGEVPLPDGPVAYDQRLSRTADAAYVLRTNGSALLVDVSRATLTVQTQSEGMLLQLVTTYGLPLLLHSAPALVLHACAAVPPSKRGAVIFCGPSGAGKSSLLVALIASGWKALSEDVSVVDVRSEPLVWPGPPWVRSAVGGPPGAAARFRTPDKTAWDIAAHQTDEPMPVGQVVFLERPGGDRTASVRIPRGEAIGRLGRSAIWLTGPDERASATFGPSVAIASAAPAARLRVPVAPDWVDMALEGIDRLLTAG